MFSVRRLLITVHEDLEIRFERVDFENGRIEFLRNVSVHIILDSQ